MPVTDNVEEDVSWPLVTKLMQTESKIGDTSSSRTLRQTVVSAAADAAATAAAARVNDCAVKTTSTDSVVRLGDNGVIDVLPEQGSAGNLHQLSLYVAASIFD